MTEEKSVEWLGAFFDAEGCVGLYPRRSHTSGYEVPKLIVNVANTDVRCLRPYQLRFGGSRFKSYKPGKAGHKQVYRWQLGGRRAYDFLVAVLPHLVSKQEQAVLAVKFWELPWRGVRGQKPGVRQGANVVRTVEQQAIDLDLARQVKALKRQEAV